MKGCERMDFQSITSNEEIQRFLEATNSLHDGYLIGVQYRNGAVPEKDKNEYYVDPENTELLLRIMVTSIWNAVVEIEFEGLLEWQIINPVMSEILYTSVFFDDKGFVVWADDAVETPKELADCSYAIAKTMKWRMIEKP